MPDTFDRLKAALADRYAIQEELGAGGMATVYLAHDVKHDRKVAVKVLRPELAAALGPERFLREIKIAANLTHPHILPLHDSGEADGFLYYVMPYVEGESLRERLTREKQLPLNDAVRIAREVADALGSAHSHDVIHRDIKPENILLEEGHAVVADFGIARAISAAGGEKLTETGMSIGTPPYMSPEQGSAGSEIDGRSDLYSLGCVLYEMLTGHPPFTGTTAQEILVRHATDPVPSIRAARTTIPAGVEQAVIKALAKVPADRFATAQGFAEALAVPEAPAQRKRLAAVFGLAWAMMLALLVGLNVGGLRDRLSRSFGTAAPATFENLSLAVLPFENLSPDPANEYFSDGMTEELISKLSRVQRLQVTARTSVARFKGTDKDIREIGEELGVRYVLEGSVRKAGDRVVITARLIDASTGFQVWSDDFDGEPKDVFAVQEETALKIAEALDLHLSPQEAEALRRRYTQHPEAYDAYLRGWAVVQLFGGGTDDAERLEAGRKHFERALALDPNYALALTGLSEIEGYYYYFGIDAAPERLQRAEQLALRALAIDPQLAEGYVALGDVYGTQGDWVRAIEAFRQGLRLDPGNAYGWEELAWAFNYQEPPEPQEAEKAAREAIGLQAGWFWAYHQLGRALYLQARYQEAIGAFEYVLQLNPAFQDAYHQLGHVYLDQGDYNRALAQFEEARNMRESPRLLRDIAAAYAGLGDMKKALAVFEDALASGYRDFAVLDTSSHFAALRTDARFQALLEKYEN